MTDTVTRFGSRTIRPIRTILLASDLSATSSGAEDLAFDLATGSAVTSCSSASSTRGRNGSPVSGIGGASTRSAPTARRPPSRSSIAAIGNALPSGSSSGRAIPGEAIVEAAVAESVDLIVVGTHGRRGMDRLVMGSVSEQVVRTAPVPVLVARAPAA